MPRDNGEEIEAGLTRRREARENEQAAIQPNVEELSTVVADAAFHHDFASSRLRVNHDHRERI